MSKESSAATTPQLLTSFDGEWSSYVRSHDEDALLMVDEPDVLQWDKLWMREIPTAQADDFGLYIDDPYYEAETCWVECAESDNGAVPWMGVKYAPAD